MQYCVIYSTLPVDGEHSKIIAEALLREKLAACISIVDNINSIYAWEGNLESSNEKLLIIKTKSSLFEKVKEQIEALHPYDCPEIIAVPIINANTSYLQWIDDNTTEFSR